MSPGGRPHSDDPRTPFNVRLSSAERTLVEQAAGPERAATWAREQLVAAAKKAVRRQGR